MASQSPPVNAAPAGSLKIIMALALVTAIGPFAIDMYLPAMPQMAEALSASPATMQLTVTGYLIGVALGPLALGPLSDAYGRKPALTGLLLLFALVSAGCALAETAEQLIWLRVLQAAAGGTAAATARAVLADLYRGDALSRATSMMMAIFTAAPVVAPLAGARLLGLGGWPWIFWALVIFAFVAILTLRTLPESLPPARRRPYRPGEVIGGYVEIMKHPGARRYLASTFAFAVVFFAMLASSPFIFIDSFGMTPDGFALIFASVALAAIMGSFVNARLVFRIGYDGMLRRATGALALLAVAMTVVAATGVGGKWGVLAVLLWLVSVFQVSVANQMAGLMAIAGHRAGAASAAIAFWRFFGGALGSFAVGAFGDDNIRPFAGVMVVGALLAAGALLLGREARVRESRDGP